MTDEIRSAVAAERRALVDLYASLTPEQWRTASLCAGWHVHEVLAHTTMPYRYSLPRFVLEMARSRGNFNRMSDRRAKADAAALSPAQLVDVLRANIDHPWTPPGGGPLGALSHDVIHGLDVSVPLGRADDTSVERVVMVLGGLSVKSARYFGVDLDGVRLEATDTDWTFGDGTLVQGRARDLLLLTCGRHLPAGTLTGPGAERFGG
ncbi:maleylpyruvate isomerase family mycothiol-dependent enzyme [Pseudonocardia sp. CA-107938]|uniref:maleylpyruvate isomerase family mycothiol-dependent enzyme n=1 Tax=Pseudonocardia sp. CA-107938 TaxID=3240021 RepID=UPI003D901466